MRAGKNERKKGRTSGRKEEQERARERKEE
jgi:hypothetical protein